MVVVVAGRRGGGEGEGIFEFSCSLADMQGSSYPKQRSIPLVCIVTRWFASKLRCLTLRLSIAQRAIAPSCENVERTRDSLMTAGFAWRQSPWCASAVSSL